MYDKAAFERALAGIGRRLGKPVRLDPRGACGVQLPGCPSPITMEWIPSAHCAAIHTPWPGRIEVESEKVAAVLMRAHLAGGATWGCHFWLTPIGEVRVGVTMVAATIDEASLLDAVGRLVKCLKHLAADRRGRLERPQARS